MQETLNPVKATSEAFSQNIMPDTPCTIGPVASKKTHPHSGYEFFIVSAVLAEAPLFVVALSSLLLGEPVRWHRLLAIAIGFAGELLILRPGTEAFTWMMLMPVMAGFYYALSAIAPGAGAAPYRRPHLPCA